MATIYMQILQLTLINELSWMQMFVLHKNNKERYDDDDDNGVVLDIYPYKWDVITGLLPNNEIVIFYDYLHRGAFV